MVTEPLIVPLFDYDIELKAFYTSPKHNYFGHKDLKPGLNETFMPQTLEIIAGKGIVGDRFFAIKDEYDGQVTFINEEVVNLIKISQENLLDHPADALLFRRNILLSGVNLIELIGKKFQIGDVIFLGVKQCAPCKWMDCVMGKGTMRLMRGRGGLRAKVLQGGQLSIREKQLLSEEKLHRDPLEALPQIRLPR